MNQDYQLISPKRDWVPEWLYRALCLTVRPLLTRWPLRGILHHAVRGEVTNIKCPHCSQWFDPREPQEWRGR